MQEGKHHYVQSFTVHGSFGLQIISTYDTYMIVGLIAFVRSLVHSLLVFRPFDTENDKLRWTSSPQVPLDLMNSH